MKLIYNARYCYAIRLKFGEKFLTFLNKLVLEGKTRICPTIEENLLLYCRKFSAFVVVVIIQHIFITRPVTQRNAACNRDHYLYN